MSRMSGDEMWEIEIEGGVEGAPESAIRALREKRDAWLNHQHACALREHRTRELVDEKVWRYVGNRIAEAVERSGVDWDEVGRVEMSWGLRTVIVRLDGGVEVPVMMEEESIVTSVALEWRESEMEVRITTIGMPDGLLVDAHRLINMEDR